MDRLKKKPGGWAGFEDYSARARMAGKAMIFTALVGLVIWIVLAAGVTLLKYRLDPRTIPSWAWARIRVLAYQGAVLSHTDNWLPSFVTGAVNLYYCEPIYEKGHFKKFGRCGYIVSWPEGFLKPVDGQAFIDWYGLLMLKTYGLALVWTAPVPLVAFFLVWRFYRRRAAEINKEEIVRGRKLVAPGDLPGRYRKRKNRLVLAENVSLPFEDETTHAGIFGRPGTGKTTLICQQLANLRDEKVVVYGYKGDFLRKFYDSARDMIFNPLDVRSVGWTVFNDLETETDVAAFAEALIPDRSAGGDPFWTNAARLLVRSAVLIARLEGNPTNRRLFEILTLPPEGLIELLSGWQDRLREAAMALQALGGDKAPKQAAAVMGTMTIYIQGLKYLEDGPFSFRRWIRDPERKGWLFLENGPEQESLYRSFLAVVVDILARETLSLPDRLDRRIFYFFDELGTMQRIPSLIKLLTLGRSKGACVVIGNQDLGRLREEYGDRLINSLYNALGALVALKVEDDFTCNFIAKNFGKVEVLEPRIQHTMSPEDFRDSISFTKDIRERYLVLPSEIAALEKFECFIRLPDGSATRSRIARKWFKDVMPEEEIFIKKKDIFLGYLKMDDKKGLLKEKSLADIAEKV